MAASMTSSAVRFWGAALLLLPGLAAAEAPGARSYALTPLEQELITTPEQQPGEMRQPVLGYLRQTEEGWKLDMLPGAVTHTGPLPVITFGVDAAPEDATSRGVYPYAPLLRIDF